MKKKDKQLNKFPGFPKEPITNYWRYPKALNGWWYILTGSEQRTLDYLLRHTWGYNKTSDHISYSQFLKGIQKKDGIWIDRGCGIKSSKTLAKALKGLLNKGFVKVVKIAGRTNFYRLKIVENIVESKDPLYKVKNPSLESKVVGSLESKDTIDDITIKDITTLSKDNGVIAPKYKIYNNLISYLKEKRGIPSLDGTATQNQRYIYHLLKHRAGGNVELIKKAIDKCNYKSFQKIYYNWNEIMSKRNRIAEI